MSPTARSRKAAPSTRPPTPYTTRVFSVTCAVTNVSAAKRRPNNVNDSPNTTEPVTGKPSATSDPATSTPVTTFMVATTISAAVGSACSPIGSERSISERPASSSPRVRRPSMNTLIRPMTISPKVPVWNAT